MRIIGKEIADTLQVSLSSLADLLVYSYTFSNLISFILKSTSFPAKQQLDTTPLVTLSGVMWQLQSRYVLLPSNILNTETKATEPSGRLAFDIIKVEVRMASVRAQEKVF